MSTVPFEGDDGGEGSDERYGGTLTALDQPLLDGAGATKGVRPTGSSRARRRSAARRG